VKLLDISLRLGGLGGNVKGQVGEERTLVERWRGGTKKGGTQVHRSGGCCVSEARTQNRQKKVQRISC